MLSVTPRRIRPCIRFQAILSHPAREQVLKEILVPAILMVVICVTEWFIVPQEFLSYFNCLPSCEFQFKVIFISSLLSSLSEAGEVQLRDVENQEWLSSVSSTLHLYTWKIPYLQNKCDAGVLETVYIVMNTINFTNILTVLNALTNLHEALRP